MPSKWEELVFYYSSATVHVLGTWFLLGRLTCSYYPQSAYQFWAAKYNLKSLVNHCVCSSCIDAWIIFVQVLYPSQSRVSILFVFCGFKNFLFLASLSPVLATFAIFLVILEQARVGSLVFLLLLFSFRTKRWKVLWKKSVWFN